MPVLHDELPQVLLADQIVDLSWLLWTLAHYRSPKATAEWVEAHVAGVAASVHVHCDVVAAGQTVHAYAENLHVPKP